MSKKYKGKTCVYCAAATSETGDHVIARAFFLDHDRPNLPQVPACMACNAEKSTLEHYLTAVLPFGGRHADASRNLAENAPPRLARNAPLHDALAASACRVWERTETGVILPSMAIGLDGEEVESLMAYVAKGLAWHHWNVILGPASRVEVFTLTTTGEYLFEHFSRWKAGQRVAAVLGTNVVAYRGSQAVDDPTIGVWEISFYGGLLMTGEAGEPTSRFGVLTGPAHTFQDAERRSAWLAGRGGSPA